MFDLKKPCDNCPFRKEGGIRLEPRRAREIAQGQIDNPGFTFPCHKTVNYDDRDEDDDTHYVWQKQNQYCAGALNFALNVGRSNQMIRIAAITGWKWKEMKEQELCFDSVASMVAAQTPPRRKKEKR